MGKSRIFDGIRGLAFLVVLVIHAFALGTSNAQTYLQGTAKYGVWLFFVLSSFLLTRNYVDAPSASKADYVVGRVLRIVPLYYLACLVYGLAGVEVTAADAGAVLGMAFGARHFWTIPVEFYFYGILLLLWMVPSVRARDVLFAVAAAVSTAALLVIEKASNSMNTLWYLPAFFVGYALARVWPRLPAIRHGSLVCVAVLAVLVGLAPGVLLLALSVPPSPYLMNWYFPISVLWAVFIFAAARSEGLVHRVLSAPAFVWLGKISYSGYLFHWLVLVLSVKVMGKGGAAIVIGLAGSIVIASLSYLMAEKPLMRLRKLAVERHSSPSMANEAT